MLVFRGLYITSWILISLKSATGTDKLSDKSALDRNKKWVVLPNVPRPGNPPAAPEAPPPPPPACTGPTVAGCPMGTEPDNCMDGQNSMRYCSADHTTQQCLWPTSTTMGCTLTDDQVDCMCAPQCPSMDGCPVGGTPGTDQMCTGTDPMTCPEAAAGAARSNCYWPANAADCAKAPMTTTPDCGCANA